MKSPSTNAPTASTNAPGTWTTRLNSLAILSQIAILFLFNLVDTLKWIDRSLSQWVVAILLAVPWLTSFAAATLSLKRRNSTQQLNLLRLQRRMLAIQFVVFGGFMSFLALYSNDSTHPEMNADFSQQTLLIFSLTLFPSMISVIVTEIRLALIDES